MEAGGIITDRNSTPRNLLTVTNLPSSVEEQHLRELFEPYADIVSITLQATNEVKRAEIVVEQEKDACFLAEEFDGHELLGATIRVTFRN